MGTRLQILPGKARSHNPIPRTLGLRGIHLVSDLINQIEHSFILLFKDATDRVGTVTIISSWALLNGFTAEIYEQ